MLLAVLEKRMRFKTAQKDVFLNIAGGLKISDPAIDLSVVASIISSYLDIAIPRTYAFIGEIGLAGEIRPVTRIESRIAEAEKLGFKRIVIPKHNLKGVTKTFNMEIIEISRIEQCLKALKDI